MRINQTDKDPCVYHYTSMNTLVKLIESDGDKLAFQATHINFLNDPLEGTLVTSILKKMSVPNDIIKKIEESIKQSYIISFCGSRDDMMMWRAYGQSGQGVALAFDKEELKQNMKEGESFFRGCVYEEDDILMGLIKKKDLDFSQSNENISNGEWKKLFVSTLKHKSPSFEPENEYRIVTTRNTDPLFKEKNGMVIPYQIVNIPIETLTEIILGPCCEKERNVKAIERLLLKRGTVAKVSKSKIKFQMF